MFAAAISQLSVCADTCEHNSAIYAAEGDAEQAQRSEANAKNYRDAIEFLLTAIPAVKH